jgi:hypothetical protein
MIDLSSAAALLRDGSSVRSQAPLDRLVYEEGDVSKVPVTPHALAVRRVLHADSRLLHGRVPANATEKDFIRNSESLRPRDLVMEAIKVKPLRQTPRVVSGFGNESAIATDALERTVREVTRALGRSAATGESRAGAGCSMSESSAAAGPPAHPAAGPPAHPSPVPESEGLRAGMSAAGSIAKLLAQRPDAPLTAAPAPEHHFRFGGSRSQLRKEQRRAENREKLREANLDLRKEQLVTRNLELLQTIAHREEEAARVTQQFIHAAVPVPLETVAAVAPVPLETPAGAQQPQSLLDSRAVQIGAGVVFGLAVVFALGAGMVASQKRKKRRSR